MTGDVCLTYRNEYGNDQPQVVIFFENIANPAALPIAWQVVDRAGMGGWHRAIFGAATTVLAEVPLLPVAPLTLSGGGILALAPAPGGAALEQTSAAAAGTIIVTCLLPSVPPPAAIGVTLFKGAPLMRASMPQEELATAPFLIMRTVSFATTTTNVTAGDPLDLATLESRTSFDFANLNALTVTLIKDNDGEARFLSAVG